MHTEDSNILVEEINLDYVRRWEAEGLSDWNTIVNIKSLPIIKPTLFHISIWNSDEELFDYLVSKNVDVELSFVNGTALHLAVKKCKDNLNIIRKLIALGVPLNTREVYMHWTALHLACFHGKVAVAEALIDAGADINITHICDVQNPEKNLGNTPLHVAVDADQSAIVELLCKKRADINAESLEWGTPLVYAILKGRIEMAKLLIYYHADINNVSKLYLVKRNDLRIVVMRIAHYTALHAAILKSHSRVLKILLLSPKIELNVVVEEYFTPLHFAIMYDSTMLKELLSAGADINVLTSKNMTILEFCMDVWMPGTVEREIMGTLLVEHATKLSLIGSYVNPKLIIDKIYAEKCNLELNLMKNYIFSEKLNMSIDKLLGCVHNLALTSSREELKVVFGPKINKIFPIYGEIIQYRALRIYQRRVLLKNLRVQSIKRFLHKVVFQELLSEHFITKVISHLSYNDLLEILERPEDV